MNRKRQSIKRVVFVILVSHCFCSQVNTKEPTKNVLAASRLSLNANKELLDATQKQTEKEELAKLKQHKQLEEVDKLLQKQEYERVKAVYQILAALEQANFDPKRSAEDGNNRLVNRLQTLIEIDKSLQQRLNTVDKQFDSRKLYQAMVPLAQGNPGMSMYISQRLIELGASKPTKKNDSWW